MKLGTGTGLYDKYCNEILMGDTLLLHDSDGRIHKIRVGFDFGMFVEEGTANSLYDIISSYIYWDGVEIKRHKNNSRVVDMSLAVKDMYNDISSKKDKK